jgi:hypothetical protein
MFVCKTAKLIPYDFNLGELDDETMKWMHMPRCGVKDVIGNGPKEKELTRKKRFALQGKILMTSQAYPHHLSIA